MELGDYERVDDHVNGIFGDGVHHGSGAGTGTGIGLGNASDDNGKSYGDGFGFGSGTGEGYGNGEAYVITVCTDPRELVACVISTTMKAEYV